MAITLNGAIITDALNYVNGKAVKLESDIGRNNEEETKIPPIPNEIKSEEEEDKTTNDVF